MKGFNELPKQIQYMIRIRMEEQGNEDTAKYMKDKKNGGFNWGETPEEFDFWNKVINYDQYTDFFKLYPHLEPEEFSKMKDTSLIFIDYTDPYWWKILKEGDEIIVHNQKNTDGVIWSVPIRTVIKVTRSDVEQITKNEEFVYFNNNQHGVNFSSNMVRLHKKNLNNNNNNNDVSRDSSTIERAIGSGGLRIPSPECEIAITGRLIGTAKSLEQGSTRLERGVLSPFQYR